MQPKKTVVAIEADPKTPQVRQPVYVGIDIGYREHVAAAIPLSQFNAAKYQDRWRRTKCLHFASNATGFRKLRSYLDALSTDPSDFLILLEPTGGYYAMTLLMYLMHEGYHVMQVENRAVKDYRHKVFGSETKTDDTDARLMARMAFLHSAVGEEFSIQPVNVTSPDDAALKVMVRDAMRLNKQVTRLKNQLQQVVAVTFPEYKDFFPSSTAGTVARRLLQKYPTPQAFAAAGPEAVTEALREARAYRHMNRAAELVALAESSAGLTAMSHLQWRQTWLIEQLAVLEDARDDLMQQLKLFVAGHPHTRLIESLPVKSTIWTATLIGVIGNIERFPNYSSFKAYMGWFPQLAQSGTSVHHSRLANSGVRLARNVLGQMAVILISPSMRSTPFREIHNRLISRHMKRGVALGHVAGKLCQVLYSLLKSDTTYDESRHRHDLGLPEPEESGVVSVVEAPAELVETLDDERDLLSELGSEELLPENSRDGIQPTPSDRAKIEPSQRQ